MTPRERALHNLDAVETRFEGRMIYAYYDSATQERWLLSGGDMDRYGELLAAAADELEAADAFDRWCRECPGTIIDINDVINEYGLDGSSDLAEAKAEAKANSDKVAFMALDHWLDHIEQILELNDEIIAEQGLAW